ncbi:MAG: VOC family protein [Clostridium sp.]|nr:VOC family protein [Clostridium sp.]
MIPIDHIQITVRDMKVAEPFYDQLMPILGYDLHNKVSAVIEEHDLYVVEYLHPDMDFGICSPRHAFRDDTVHRRKPGALHHLAFRAKNRQEVDRLYSAITAIGAHIVHSPRIFPEHGPNYYAMFFKDPDGIKFEIVHNAPDAMERGDAAEPICGD